MLDKIKENLVNDLGFEAQVGDTGIVDENGNFAEPSPYLFPANGFRAISLNFINFLILSFLTWASLQ